MAIKKTVFTEIEEVENARKREIESLTKSLEESIESKAKAEARAATALENKNADEYTRAKEDIRRAEDKVEFYNIQLKADTSKPLFTDPSERTEKIEAVKAAAESTRREKTKAAAALLIEAGDLILTAKEEIERANKTLEKLYKGTGAKSPVLDVVMLAALYRRIAGSYEHNDIKTFV